MNYCEKAAELEKGFFAEEKELDDAALKVAQLILNWEKELKPITDFLKTHKIKFKNEFLKGFWSFQGFLIGKKSADVLFVLKDGYVFTVDAEDNISEEKQKLSEFLKSEFAFLEIIKSGLDYVDEFTLPPEIFKTKIKNLTDFFIKFGA